MGQGRGKGMGGAMVMLPYVGQQILNLTLIYYVIPLDGIGLVRLGFVSLGYIGIADNSQQLFLKLS